VPSVPTHLDLIDDDTVDAADGADQFSIDFEAVSPASVGRKTDTAGGRIQHQAPPPPPEKRSDAGRSAPERAASPKADPRLALAQEDALRLGIQLRAALDKAQTNSLMVCGVEPGQTVRRLARELALAFVQLRETPVLVVDLEPGEGNGAGYEFYPLTETDSASWLNPGPMGRPSAAVLCPSRRQQNRRGSVVSAQFAQSFDNWQAQAAVVICCGPSASDSIATLTAGRCCGATLLVVPGSGSTNASVMSARDLCARSGLRILGCVIDHTPADSRQEDQ
jgi:hypothetical protein